MAEFPSYAIGTVSVAEGDTTVVGTGTIWSGVNARAGDVIDIDGYVAEILDVVDVTHLTITKWNFGAVSNADYRIIKKSPLRFAGGQAMADVEKLLAILNTAGLPVIVPPDATEPDASLGEDGQHALQPDTGKAWSKQGGVWVYLGIYRAFGIPAPWSSSAEYQVMDVATLAGSSYVCIVAHTNHSPPNSAYWSVLAAKGNDGEDGANGADGADGADGATGAAGPAAWSPVEPWATGHVYSAADPKSVVATGGETYVCATTHTSGTFATDLAAGKWIKLAAKGADGAPGADGGVASFNGATGAITLVGPPQGRLTLTSGVAVTTGDVSGATSVYYTPAGGRFVPIHDGTRFQMKDIGGELTLALDSNSGHTNYHWSANVYDFFIIDDAGTIRLGTGPRWSSGSGGTNTSRGTGATDISVVSGIKVNAATITIRFGSGAGDTVSVPANRATYVGSGYMTANGQIDDTALKRLLYNEYNKAPRSLKVAETANSWSYSTASYRQANNSSANQVAVLDGGGSQSVHAEIIATAANSTSTFVSIRVGVGIDSSTVNSARAGVNSASNAVNSVPSAVYDGVPGLGYHEVRWLERGGGSDTQTWYGGGVGIDTGLSGWTVG